MHDGPILIWGAGAIGGTIGAFLRRAGHAVTFVDLVEEHVAAIAAGRLAIRGPVAEFATGGPAFTPATLQGSFRRVILAVKAHQTEAAARQIAPHLAHDGWVLSAQNGLNELVLAETLGRQRVIGAFVNFGADWHGPGDILYANRGAVVVGELDGAKSARITAIHRLMQDFDADAVLAENIFAYLWGKTGYGALLKASALTNETIADFIEAPELRPLHLALIGEVMAVAAAEKVRPIGFNGYEPDAFAAGDMTAIDASIAAMVAFNRSTAKPRSGVWRDLAVRKRPTDSAAQLAPVRAAACRHGIATPVLERLVVLIGMVERGEREIGMPLARELLAAAQDVEGAGG
ncbi:ketopantoate reductase family protein [Roseomonas sp. HF4]|uniref:ketopantoate reductase family protein n=1 Tax=Roseomonas sp. HF4 TaxID=2562313 RepID=UPI0010C07251|nr:2-dehydropantoate 2-reductase N-terminal domain-containing protein [Roseomonas sp. HF4]